MNAFVRLSATIVVLVLSIPIVDGNEAMCPNGALKDEQFEILTNSGSIDVGIVDYRFAIGFDQWVIDEMATEHWARIYYPRQFLEQDTQTSSKSKLPIIIVMHGNHDTCKFDRHGDNDDRIDSESAEYSYVGFCSPYLNSTVIENHLGYEYFAKPLASIGYIVVSINTNMGINAFRGGSELPGLIETRSRLILAHISTLAAWNQGKQGGPIDRFNPKLEDMESDVKIIRKSALDKNVRFEDIAGFSLENRLDLNNIALIGHSRGAEAIIGALDIYNREANKWKERFGGQSIQIKGLFSIAPTGFEDPLWNPSGALYIALLPLCDGDVYSVKGSMFLDFATTTGTAAIPKAALLVWGSNHNFYNTEWQRSDSKQDDCSNQEAIFENDATSSTKQQELARRIVLAFAQSILPIPTDQKKRTIPCLIGTLIDPKYDTPAVIKGITRVDRDFLPTEGETTDLIMENFHEKQCSKGKFNCMERFATGMQLTIGTLTEHWGSLKVAKVKPTKEDVEKRRFSLRWNEPVTIDPNVHYILSFRISVGWDKDISSRDPVALSGAISLLYKCQNPDAKVCKRTVDLANYPRVYSAVNKKLDAASKAHDVLQTIAMPLEHFFGQSIGDELGMIGVEFAFESILPSDATVYLANIRLRRRLEKFEL